MDQQTYIIKFNDATTAEANRYANELRNFLLDSTSDIKVDQRRDDSRTQDFGSILVLVLGTSSVNLIAKAIGNWLQLRNQASLTIATSEKKVIAKNLTSKDAARLTELFLKNE